MPDPYKIKSGDNFWKLENQWGLPHGTLQELNPNLNPRALQIDQVIETFSWECTDVEELSLPLELDENEDIPLSGSIPYAIGQASVVRIPVPKTNGLAIEFVPRGHVPSGGSTSTLFIQNIKGNRHLRLDYGYNKRASINAGRDIFDYHWNQKGTSADFKGKIQNHDSIKNQRLGKLGHSAAKIFRWGGRALLVVGVAVDTISIVQASNPIRRSTEVVTAWALAWCGCKVVGAAGAAGGTAIAPGPGTAILGVGGCIVGGIGGYMAGEKIGGIVYDWAEETIFTPLPEISQ